LTLNEIRESGQLELFVLNLLTEEERKTVIEAMETYPELRQDLVEIETALEVYAGAASLTPPPGVKEKVLAEIRSGDNPPTSLNKNRNGNGGSDGAGWRFVSLILGLALAGVLYFMLQGNQKVEQLTGEVVTVRDSCETINAALNARIDLLENLVHPGNQISHMDPTPAYAGTDLYFHHNPTLERNFIQVVNLPEITADQSYQLWSLKADTNPIPLTVFESDAVIDSLIEVAYEDGTATYAITIEPRGGVQSPTLENLISTVGVLN